MLWTTQRLNTVNEDLSELYQARQCPTQPLSGLHCVCSSQTIPWGSRLHLNSLNP
jgi:hypothetical protein